MAEPYKVIEPLPEGVLSQEQGISMKKPRKFHVQLHNEVFRKVGSGSPQQADPKVTSMLPPNPHRIKRRKTHQELWQEACPNVPKSDVSSALVSPVSELPTFNQTPRLGRSRSGSIARTQPAIGVSRTPSQRSPQPSPPNLAPPASLPGRMRAMSRATARPAIGAEPSTRTERVSLSFLSRSVEENPSDKENSSVSMQPTHTRRSGSIVQRAAHMLTHPDGEYPILFCWPNY